MINRISKFFKLYHLGILSGVLVGTTYIPFPPWALFFCYTPLFVFATRTNPSATLKQTFWAGWWTQFVLTMIGFHWIAWDAHEFGFMPWPAAIMVLVLFASIMHIYIPVGITAASWVSQKLNLNPIAKILVLAGFLTLFEMHWPVIFQWNLGYPLLWIHSPLAQWADTIGFQGLSFFVYLINALVTGLWLNRSWKIAGIWVGITSVVLGLLYWGGIQKSKQWKNTDSNLKTLIIQANIGNLEKFYAEKGLGFQQFIADEFFNLTREALKVHPNADLVLWPESAYPEVLDNYAIARKQASQFRQFTQSIAKPIMTGAYSKDGPEVVKRNDYNGLFLFNQNGELIDIPYRKTELLIFGEYLPLVDTFPALAKLNPGGSGFGRGPGPTILPLPLTGNTGSATGEVLKIGAQICYESLYPYFSTKLSRLGAEILVNVTNDSWFGPSFEPEQHLFMTLARGLEVRRPLLRATNTGISTAILADGTVLEQSPLNQKWFGLYEINYLKNPPQTFFAQFGSWLSGAIFVFLLLVILIGKPRERKS